MATSALIVVTSMWRLERDVPALLKALGFAGECHEDWRMDNDGPTRGDEIERWLAAHGELSYVILDDKPIALDHQRPRLVLTDHWQGFQAWEYAKALALLNDSRAPS